MFKQIITYLQLLVAALLVAACNSEPELTKVDMMLDWVPNTNHTGLYVAQTNGYYEEAGLDVSIIQPGQTAVEQVVGAGQAQFGISYQEGVTFALAEGAPLVSVAAIIQHNSSGFASRANAGIEGPADFEGKLYGSFSSPVEKPMIDLLMSCEGANGDEVEFVDVGFADFLSITEGDVDFAWIFYGWQGIDAELKGIDLNVVMLNEYQDCVPDYYTPTLITSQGLIDDDPELVEAFVNATARGYEFAITNPDEAADILLEATPELDAELVKASQQWLANEYQSDAAQWGLQSTDIWQGYADWLHENGILAEPVDTSSAFSNDFLP